MLISWYTKEVKYVIWIRGSKEIRVDQKNMVLCINSMKLSMHETMHTKHTYMLSMHESMLSMHKTMHNMHSSKNHILINVIIYFSLIYLSFCLYDMTTFILNVCISPIKTLINFLISIHVQIREGRLACPYL